MSEEATSSVPVSDASSSANVSEASSATNSNASNSATPSEKSSSTISEVASTTEPSEVASSIQIIEDSSSSNIKPEPEPSNTSAVSSSEKKNSIQRKSQLVQNESADFDPTEQSTPMDISDSAQNEESSETVRKLTMTDDMREYMDEAFQEARKALADGEVPVGCVFVYHDEVIARGGNFVNSSKNPTRHAEFQCMDQTFDYCSRHSLQYEDVFAEISVFVTVEPCIMCAASLYEFGVKEIIYGCTNDRFGGRTVVDVEEFIGKKIPTLGGVRANEAKDLLREFYKGENPSAPVPKKKRD